MSETKFVFCENCKRVFEMDAVSHINECPACDVPNPMPEIPQSVADELAYLQRINYVYPKLQSKTLDEWEGKK